MGGAESKEMEDIFSMEELADISDNPQRIKFEQYLIILVMLEQFGTHGWSGSMQYKPLDYDQITSREHMAKNVQKFKLSDELIEWVKLNMPEKLIKHLNIPEFMYVAEKDFANDESYGSYISEVVKYLQTNLDNLSEQTKMKIAERIQWKKKLAHGKECLKNKTKAQTDSKELFKEIKIKAQNYSKELFKELKTISDAEKILSEAFTSGYFNKETFSDIEFYISNPEYPELEEIKQSHLTKYYKEIWVEANPDKAHFGYYLNFSDHWDLYCACPTEYLKMIVSNCLVDDYTFEDYKFDYYGFLDYASPTVKTNIINKIKSDNNQKTTDRYGPIASLEDLVDVSIFVQNPPVFLRHSGLNYYPEYNKMMYQYLASIEWNWNKLDYLTYNIIPSYRVERTASLLF